MRFSRSLLRGRETRTDALLVAVVFATHGVADAFLTLSTFLRTERVHMESNPFVRGMLREVWPVVVTSHPWEARWAVLPVAGVMVGAVAVACALMWLARTFTQRRMWRGFVSLMGLVGVATVLTNMYAVL